MSQPQTIYILEVFKDLCMQKCLSRKSSISWKSSKTFSPAKLSQPQIIYILEFSKTFLPAKMSQLQVIDILETFKDFFACKNVLAANHRYPGNSQRLFRLLNCRSRKSSISWKYSKTFSAATLSQPQIIYILEIFKDFFGCKIVSVATHQYSENIQRLFRLQNCLSSKSSISWKLSKTFSPAKMSQQQPIIILKRFKDFFACKNVLALNYRYPGNLQKLFWLQKCLSSNPSKFSKYSETLSPAELSEPQTIDILEIFKDLFECKNFLAATHPYSEKNSKSFSPAKLSQPQIIDILEIFKDFFGCKNVVDANHRCLGNIQRLFRLKTCLSHKSSISWIYSKFFPPAKLSQQQPINIVKMFKNFFAC